MAYRPPVSGGRDAIGNAIGSGLAGGAAAVAAGLDEQRRRAIEDEERRRRERLQQLAEEDRQRRILLENAEVGVVDPADAMEGDPIARAVPLPGGGYSVPKGGLVDPRGQPPKLRDGVTRVGDLYVDPSRSLGFQRQKLVQDQRAAEEQQEIQRRASALMAADPTMDEGDAIARAMGLNANSPLTMAEAEAQRRRQLEMEAEFRRAEEARSNAEWDRRARSEFGGVRGARGGLTANQALSRQEASAEGFALTAATEAQDYAQKIAEGTLRAGPGWTPLVHVRSKVRAAVRQAGYDLSEGEIQAIAVRALQGVESQGLRSRRANQDDLLSREGQGALRALEAGVSEVEVVNNLAARAGVSPADARQWLGLE